MTIRIARVAGYGSYLAFVITIVGLGVLASPAEHAGVDIFELDGNAVQDAATPPEDWELLYDSGADTGGSSIAFTGVIADPGQETIFVGGRKDIQDITNWGWKNNGGFPDKNDITNAYAAAYTDINGDLIVYFGADRFSNTGDAFLGFWFFKDEVTLDPEEMDFNGQHQIGDILVLVNYPQGANAEPEIQVIEWNPDLEDVGNNLHLLFSGTGAVCGAVPPADACAITNLMEQMSPWPYQPKDGFMNVYPSESFFEGGINLTQILGGTTCFSTFLAETRSSTSITATLKDFVIGSFPVCGIDVEKTCQVMDLTDDNLFVVEFQGNVINSGGGTFPAGALVTVVDDAGTPGDDTDDVVIEEVLAEPLLPGDLVPFSGSFLGAENPPYNTVSATISFGDTVVNAGEYGTECEPLPLNPMLDLTKECSTSLTIVDGLVVVQVDFVGEVTNTGDVPLVVTVTDDPAGEVLAPTLLLSGESAPLSGSYLPMEANGGETDPAQAMFSDTLTAVGESPVLQDPVVEMITATCPLCP